MPTQYPSTATGNWRARYFAEFFDAQGRKWRVEVIDHDTSNPAAAEFNFYPTGIHEVELAENGFTLSWDGPTDHVGGSIIPSTCEVTLAIRTAPMEPLVDVIKTSDDDRFGLAVYYDDGGQYWKPWWVGILNHEAIEYETKDRPYLVTLKASCGLRRLNNIEFAHNGGPWLTTTSLANCVAKCINNIPTADFWLGNTTQFSEVVDLFNEGHAVNTAQWSPTTAGDVYPYAVLERTVVSTAAFYEKKEPKEDDFGRRAHYPLNFNSCGDVLEHIATAFGGRFLLSRGRFWFMPINALNWSHSLNVVSYTRNNCGALNLDTQMLGGYNADVGQSSTVNFEKDLEADHALGDGWTNSYLLPVKRATIQLTDAGQRSAFGSPRNFYLDYPNSGGGNKTFANYDMTVSEGDTLNVRGRYLSGDLVKEFGNTIGGGAYNNHGTDRIGARIIVRLKLKVGNLYYSSEYNVDTSQQTAIDMPTGFNGDFTDPNLSFNTVHVPNPQWTTEEKFYDIIVPWTHSTPAAEVVEDGDGWARVGGLHIRATDNNEFEYRVNQTQQDDVAHDFDFMTVPLPNNSSSYNGVTCTVDRIVVTRNGTVRQTFPELDNIFHSVAFVPYDHTGATVTGTPLPAPEDRVEELVVGVGNNSDDADIDFFVEQSANTEFLDLGTTVLGDNVTAGVPQSDGALAVIEYGFTLDTPSFTSTGWRSITDGIDQLDSPTGLLIANCREQLLMRGSVLPVQRGTIVPKVSTATNTTAPLDVLTVLFHNCSTPQDDRDDLVPLTMTHQGGPATYTVDAIVRKRTRLSYDEPIAVPSPPFGSASNGADSSGGGSGPNGGVSPAVPKGGSSTNTFDFNTGTNLAAVKFDTAVNTADIAPIKGFVGNVYTAPPTRGGEILTIDTSGVMTRVADGTSGQALTTDGQGVLRFTTVGGSAVDNVNMASNSVSINMTKANDFYLGNTVGGWAANTWNVTMRSSVLSIPASQSNCGVIIPKNLTEINLFGTVIPAVRNDITVSVFTCQRPNNSSSSLTLNRVATTTVRVSTTGVPLTADVTASNLQLRAGDLLIVGVSRAGTNVSSAVTPFTYTLVGE